MRPERAIAAVARRCRRTRLATQAAAALACLAVVATAGPATAGPAAAADGAPAPRVAAAPAVRFNVAAPHSPRLLKMLATGPGPGSAAGSAATSNLLRGIDVSSFQHPQGAAIDWAKVAAAGYRFAFVKATEGSYYVNPYYRADTKAARRAGLLTAAYHFAIPNDSRATLQADLALNTAGDPTAGGQTLPLILDIEYDPYVSLDHTNACYGLSHAAMVAWISAFVAEVKRRTGQPPVIYTIAPWWHQCTGDSAAFTADPLWVAWNGSSPTLPAGWTSWEYWQYTSTATVPGITVRTDVSYFSATVPDAAAPPVRSDAAGSAATLAIHSLDAAAGQPLTWAASGLPPGMAVDPATGVIAGTLPATAASYRVTLTATDGAAHSQTLAFPWYAHGPVTLVWPGRQSGAAGGAVDRQLHARDGLARCTLTFTAAGLPPGLAISRCGRITGRPTRPGQYRVIVTVAGSDGRPLASIRIAWTVAPPPVLASGRLRLRIGGMCMAVPSGLTVRIRTCGRSAGQVWQVGQNGFIRIGGRCLAELTPSSARPVLRRCTNRLAQIWQQTAAGGMANAQAGRCLTDPGASRRNGTAVRLSACAGTRRQAWTLPRAPLAVGSGRCVAGTAATGGTPGTLRLTRCGTARSAGQDWRIAPDGAISVPGGCLATTGKAAGTLVSLSACPRAGTRPRAAERWRPAPGPAGTGSFLINPASGLCLAVPRHHTAANPLALGYCQAGYPSRAWHTG